jgi:hypothetical protein
MGYEYPEITGFILFQIFFVVASELVSYCRIQPKPNGLTGTVLTNFFAISKGPRELPDRYLTFVLKPFR